jgi:sorbitol/mannitol transport system permease protein
MLSWTWIPFATLLILTSLKSIDKQMIESAKIDGANSFQISIFIILPNIIRSINVIILLETIFFLAVFAEISIATNGGPGTETTNLPFLIFQKGLQNFDVGESSAGGLIAVLLANFVAIFLINLLRKNI